MSTKEDLQKLHELVTKKDYDSALQLVQLLKQTTTDRAAKIQLQQIEINIHRLMILRNVRL